jgi:hypothetical protein
MMNTMRLAALLLLPLVAGCDHGGSSCGSREAVIAELPDVRGDDEACEEPPRCEGPNTISTCVDGELHEVSCGDVCREQGLSPDECAENEQGVDECVCFDDAGACG